MWEWECTRGVWGGLIGWISCCCVFFCKELMLLRLGNGSIFFLKESLVGTEFFLAWPSPMSRHKLNVVSIRVSVVVFPEWMITGLVMLVLSVVGFWVAGVFGGLTVFLGVFPLLLFSGNLSLPILWVWDYSFQLLGSIVRPLWWLSPACHQLSLGLFESSLSLGVRSICNSSNADACPLPLTSSAYPGSGWRWLGSLTYLNRPGIHRLLALSLWRPVVALYPQHGRKYWGMLPRCLLWDSPGHCTLWYEFFFCPYIPVGAGRTLY